MRPLTPLIHGMALALVCAPFSSAAQAQDPTETSEPSVPAHDLFEMRALATRDSEVGGERVDMAREVLRVRAWLECGEHRAEVLADPRRIHEFNRWVERFAHTTTVHWYPHVVRPGDKLGWSWSQTRIGKNVVVPLFDPARLTEPAERASDYLVELVPVCVGEKGFATSDLDPDSIRLTESDATGRSVVMYAVRPELHDTYADWTEERVNKQTAIVVDGVAVTLPTIMTRIPGTGMIEGGGPEWTEQHLESLVKELRAGARSERRKPPAPAPNRDEARKSLKSWVDLDADIVMARRRRVGAGNAQIMSIYDANAVGLDLGDLDMCVHGIPMSLGPPGPSHRFVLVSSLWRSLVDREAPDYLEVEIQGGLEYHTGRVFGVVGQMEKRPDGTKVLIGSHATPLR